MNVQSYQELVTYWGILLKAINHRPALQFTSNSIVPFVHDIGIAFA